jgi:hypothetical protein
LCRFPSVKATAPQDYENCLDEAVSSHDKKALNGIITTASVAETFSTTDIVTSIEEIYGTNCWEKRGPSIRLHRTTNDYLHHLQFLLKHTNFIMFIHPHLNLDKYHYNEFHKTLAAIPKRDDPLLIEIH